MGVQPRPPDDRPQDHFCWPAGQTPWVIKVFATGIEHGPTWTSPNGKAPNGYFDMVRAGPITSRWDSSPPEPSFHINLTPAISHLHGRGEGGSSAFYHDDLFHVCKKYYDNQAGPFGVDFRYGNAWVTGYTFPWDIAELVMNAYWDDPNYECFPMDSEQLAIRVARIRDGTNIMIKFDHDLA